MEQSSHVAVVPADPQWSDVGSWHAIWELMDKDAQGNARQGDTIAVQAHDNLIRSDKRLVALAGVSGLAVIETADALLVVDRENSEAVRGVVDALARAERREAVIHAREVRPWGRFTGPARRQPGYKVKEVVVDRARPADPAVPSRPRRDLGDRGGRGAGAARRRGAAPAGGPEHHRARAARATS